jgi:hypothetical protein
MEYYIDGLGYSLIVYLFLWSTYCNKHQILFSEMNIINKTMFIIGLPFFIIQKLFRMATISLILEAEKDLQKIKH